MSDNISQFLAGLQDTILDMIDITQVITLIVILLISWLLQSFLPQLLNTLKKHLPAAFWSRSAMVMAHSIVLPVAALVLTRLTIEIFKGFGQNTGLLELTNRLIIIWLIYRVLAALIYANLTSEKAHFWGRKVLLPLIVVIGLLSIFGLLENILAWGIYIDAIGWRLTLGSILLAIGIVIAFVALSRWVGKFLASSFLPGAGLEPSLINTISKVVTYTIVAFGVLIALGSMGIDLTTLTVILGGLSVGLAFGLQEIINNFVSGFILLFERSLVTGDVIKINDDVGTVQKIGIRSTIIKTRDNVDLIIPNSHFLTEIVTNLTHTEELVRARISVGVTYNANPREVEQALLEVAAQHSAVLVEPPPTVQFKDFGDSSLNFDLLVWTNEALQNLVLTSDLRYGIWDALAARNIEIPFPQRDIHIRSDVSRSSLAQPTRVST